MSNLKYIISSILIIVIIYYFIHYSNKNNGGSSFGSTLYTGVATFGRFEAVIGAIFGVIIAIVLINIGIGKLHDPHTATAQMTITESVCGEMQPQNNSSVNEYGCNISVFFDVNGTRYTIPNVSVTSQTPLKPGMFITLRYNPSNPTSVVQEISPRALGWGLIGGGSLLGIGTVTIAVLTFKYKSFAAVEGTLGIFNAFNR